MKGLDESKKQQHGDSGKVFVTGAVNYAEELVAETKKDMMQLTSLTAHMKGVLSNVVHRKEAMSAVGAMGCAMDLLSEDIRLVEDKVYDVMLQFPGFFEKSNNVGQDSGASSSAEDEAEPDSTQVGHAAASRVDSPVDKSLGAQKRKKME